MTTKKVLPSYRRATPEDAREVAAIVNSIVSEGGPPVGLHPMSRDHVWGWIRALEPRGFMVVAECDGLAAGFSVIEPAPAADAAVLRVYVLREYRMRGIGRELARLALEQAREQSFTHIKGYIPEGNEPALSFMSTIAPLIRFEGANFEFEL